MRGIEPTERTDRPRGASRPFHCCLILRSSLPRLLRPLLVACAPPCLPRADHRSGPPLPRRWNYDLTRKCLIAEAWCPISKYDEAVTAVRRGASRSGAQVPSIVNVIDTEEKPPTFFQQNKFTGELTTPHLEAPSYPFAALLVCRASRVAPPADDPSRASQPASKA